MGLKKRLFQYEGWVTPVCPEPVIHGLRAVEQVAVTTQDTITRKCPGGSSLSYDPIWSDGFREQEEGLGRSKSEKQADRQKGRQGEEKELGDTTTRAEDLRTMKEEEEREDIGGKQPGSNEDQKGGTETARGNEEEDKEERSSGPRGGKLSLGGGVNRGPARKENIAKEPHNIAGGAWLDKVRRLITRNIPTGAKGLEGDLRES
ncbi:hypothetical protein NDU88_006648 [Pleurodeles waltl]|uniref:Uncharacterized protein n=1 Tax=Pleurodeles waltl TaxID=8319 RepID=A0AAV7NUN3_PLEWA|nr:hypothetical protein NDU88_006648 [Pleurodeles waltl]